MSMHVNSCITISKSSRTPCLLAFHLLIYSKNLLFPIKYSHTCSESFQVSKIHRLVKLQSFEGYHIISIASCLPNIKEIHVTTNQNK